MLQLQCYLLSQQRRCCYLFSHINNSMHIFIYAAAWRLNNLYQSFFLGCIFPHIPDNINPDYAREHRPVPPPRLYFFLVMFKTHICSPASWLSVTVSRCHCTHDKKKKKSAHDKKSDPGCRCSLQLSVHSCIPAGTALNGSLQVNKCWLY